MREDIESFVAIAVSVCSEMATHTDTHTGHYETCPHPICKRHRAVVDHMRREMGRVKITFEDYRIRVYVGIDREGEQRDEYVVWLKDLSGESRNDHLMFLSGQQLLDLTRHATDALENAADVRRKA